MRRLAKNILQFVAGLALVATMSTEAEARTWAKSNTGATARTELVSENGSECGCSKSVTSYSATTSPIIVNTDFGSAMNAGITDECNDFIHCIGGYSCLISALKCAGSDMILFSELVMY